MEIGDLEGEWAIETISGPWWFMGLKGDVKTIEGGKGYNTIWGFKWGKFVICKDKNNPEIIILTYLREPIVDKIRFIDENSLTGDFYWRGREVGKFKMTRKIT